MRRTSHVLLTLALILLAAIAGCLEGDGDNATQDPEDPGVIDPDGGGTTGTGAGADFTVTPEPARAGVDLEFAVEGATAGGEDENDTDAGSQYVWDFGDGSSGEGPQTTQVYQDGGVYTVTLQVTAASGEEDNTTRELEVLPPPEADLNETWEGEFPAGAPVESGSWVDEHDVSLDEGQTNVTLELTGQGTGATMDLYLLDDEGEEVASETGGGAEQTMEIPGLEAGSYTAKVHMTGGSSGSYELVATGTAAVPQPEAQEDAGGEP